MKNGPVALTQRASITGSFPDVPDLGEDTLPVKDQQFGLYEKMKLYTKSGYGVKELGLLGGGQLSGSIGVIDACYK